MQDQPFKYDDSKRAETIEEMIGEIQRLDAAVDKLAEEIAILNATKANKPELEKSEDGSPA